MSTGSVQPFLPNGTATIAASTTSAAAAIPPGDSLLVYNASTAVAFITTGSSSSVTATVAAGVPVPPGGRQLFSGGPFVSYVAAILASGSGNVYVTAGAGTAY